MSRNGTGTYSPPSNSWSPATNGNAATAADWNATLTDLSNALTQSVSADGQTPITGNLNLGGNRVTNVAAPSANGDVLVQGSAVTAPTLTSSGNVNFTGTGNRITGDFSNATVANRVMFQTSTANSPTSVMAIPSGTGTSTLLQLLNSSSATNCSLVQLQATSSEISFRSEATGTGSFLPMTFYTGGAERMRIDTSGLLIAGLSQSAQFPPSAIALQETSHATSKRASIQIGLRWLLLQDSAGNGTKDLQIYDIVAGASRFTIDTSGNATFTGTVTATNLFGQGQTLQNVSGSRALGTTYTNTTARPITVEVNISLGAGGSMSLTRGGSIVQQIGNNTASTTNYSFSCTVIPGQTYSVTASGTPTFTWWETR